MWILFVVGASAQHAVSEFHTLSDSLICQDYLRSGNYELAMDKAMRYRDLGNDYRRALSAVNLALKINGDLDKLEMKKASLQSSGQLREAIAIYEEIINKTERINTETFDRQIEQLRVLNDLNDLEKQDRELKLKSRQEALKRRQIAVSIGFLLVLMGLLYVLWRMNIHTKRLRNELLQEKDSLIASEKQLRVVTEEAEAANKKKSAFIANISHEVRTPLNAIVGFSELLASSEYDEADKIEFAGEVNHSSELLLNLVNDVLDLSRLESNKIKFSVKPSDLVACCQKVLDSIRHRVKPGVRLTFAYSPESYTLHTDALRLQQLLTNLLSNAAKFTSEGEINLSFTVDESQGEVRFSVTDTGCGIPEDKYKKIFERFEKLDDFIQGTGLGLSVCQIISEQLNGSLSLDISYKGGARFVFIHPTNLIETPI
ncbi:MAG: HAMP domain-containing sensor histidine kinase [Parabacteroides sp.]|nr:HAMP domain-containing sensor histidine kinase [Parabacteroides sp.]